MNSHTPEDFKAGKQIAANAYMTRHWASVETAKERILQVISDETPYKLRGLPHAPTQLIAGKDKVRAGAIASQAVKELAAEGKLQIVPGPRGGQYIIPMVTVSAPPARRPANVNAPVDYDNDSPELLGRRELATEYGPRTLEVWVDWGKIRVEGGFSFRRYTARVVDADDGEVLYEGALSRLDMQERLTPAASRFFSELALEMI